MPLKSRASEARIARQEGDSAEEQTQPRKPSQNASKPAPAAAPSPPAEEPAAPPASAPAASEAAKTEAAPAERTASGRKRVGRPPGSANKPTTRTPPAVAGTDDPKALRTRQREIEKEFKGLGKEHTAAVREVEQKFAARRKALEDEHQQIAGKLSAQVFGRT